MALTAPQQTTGDQVFGNKTLSPTPLSHAPIEAFGDPRGQEALANAVGKVGDAFFDIYQRKTALERAEEDTTFEKKKIEFSQAETEVRLNLEKEQETNYRTAAQKEEEYTLRISDARQKLLGDTKWKYYKDSTVADTFDLIQKNNTLAYQGGQLEKDRLDNIQSNIVTQSNILVDNAAQNGKDNSPSQLASTIKAIGDLYTNPRTLTAMGQAKAEATKQQLIEKALANYVTEYAGTDPVAARKMLEDPQSPLLTIVSTEQLAALHSDLTDIVQNKQRDVDMAIEKKQQAQYGVMLLGIQDVRPDTGKPTTRIDVKNDPILTNQQKATLLNQIDAESRTRDASSNKAKELQMIIDAGGSAAGAIGQDDADAWYRTRYQSLADLPEAQRQLQIGREVAQLGIVPTQLAAVLQGRVMSSNDSMSIPAAIELHSMFEANPRLIKSFPEETQAFVASVSIGMSPKDARDNIKRSNQMTEVERKIWTDNAKKDLEKEKSKDLIRESTKTGRLWKTTPIKNEDIPPQAQADYELLYQQYLLKTQDTAAAKNLAQQKFREKWSVTNADGSERLIPHAPEVVHKNVREELQFEMKKQGLKEGDYTVEWIPSSDPQRPQYYINKIRSGLFVGVLPGPDGTPFVWTPSLKDWQAMKDEENKRLDAERQQARSKAFNAYEIEQQRKEQAGRR